MDDQSGRITDGQVDPSLLLRLEHAVADILITADFSDGGYPELLAAIGSALDWPVGAVWTAEPMVQPDGPTKLHCLATWQSADSDAGEFIETSRKTTLGPGVGLPGAVWASGRSAWMADVLTEANFPRATAARRAGLHAAFCFPIVSSDGVEALMEFLAPRRIEPEDVLLATMTSLGLRIGDGVRRQRIDAAVRLSEARLRAVLAASLDAIIIADADGVVLEFNPAACETFGYGRTEAIGRELAELIVPPTLRARHRRGLTRYVHTAKARALDRRIEIDAMRKNGSSFPVELTITRVAVPGRPIFAGYVRDLTQRRRAEGELLASRRRVAEAAVAERQRLERDLHDGAQQRLISLGTELARARTVLPGRPDRAAEILDQAIATLEDAAIELRDLARGIHPSSLTRYGLGAALADIARRSPVEIAVGGLTDERFPASIEATTYFVVSEALTNVARHAGTARARVVVTVTSLGSGSRALDVVVADEGIGGAAADGGSGLRGLADRVALLDGSFEMVSPDGAGTIIRVRLPLPS